jgi:hypothetical protein
MQSYKMILYLPYFFCMFLSPRSSYDRIRPHTSHLVGSKENTSYSTMLHIAESVPPQELIPAVPELGRIRILSDSGIPSDSASEWSLCYCLSLFLAIAFNSGTEFREFSQTGIERNWTKWNETARNWTECHHDSIPGIPGIDGTDSGAGTDSAMSNIAEYDDCSFQRGKSKKTIRSQINFEMTLNDFSWLQLIFWSPKLTGVPAFTPLNIDENDWSQLFTRI